MVAEIDTQAWAAPESDAERSAAAAQLELSFPLKGLSFQNRIAVVALVTAVAVLMAACMMFMLQQWRTERAHFTQNQAVLAKVAASEASAALTMGDLGSLHTSIDALTTDPRVHSAALIDSKGVRIAGFRRPGSDRGLVRTEAPVVYRGATAGTVVITSEPEGLAGLLPRFISMGGALFFVAAGLALFMGRWLASRLTRPVDRLSHAMQEVAGSGDFARRVEHGENDEFGRLTSSFNALLAQLQKNDQELRKTMDELVEARDAAEAANVLKSHFLANMSHEIRTPLNGVLAMSQIMAMGELQQTQRERLAVISQSGEALLTVLNDILDLSKIEAGRMEIEDAEFDTAELVDAVEAIHRPMALGKGLSFSIELTPSARGARRGDPTRLQQILNNLVANAVKFTHVGEVRVRIDGEGPDGEAGLSIAVRDSGIGVAADKVPLLFQKFSQVDSSTTRQYGGTGLGLAICRELAQLMGGTVWAESVQGVGSTFSASLPLARTAPGVAAADEIANRAAKGDVSTLKILAAEDNPTNRLVLKTVLATFGLDVEIVPDGLQAVDAWSHGQYDLILMDIQMPVMDGITATRAIRKAEVEEGRARTPIVALSANAMTHQVREYLDAGMDMHVAKPIQLAKLQHALEIVLSDQAEPQQDRQAASA